MPEPDGYILSLEDVQFLRELKRRFSGGEFIRRPRHQKHRLPYNYGSMLAARLTSTMDDDNPTATANIWEWDADAEEWIETDEEVELHSFLRPEGASIAERTRVYFTAICGVWVIIVNNCDADPEEEETP